MNLSIPKWIFKILSYLTVFLYGGYVYGANHGNNSELYHWIITALFGIFFYILSLPNKNS
jgi:hypothetical protein